VAASRSGRAFVRARDAMHVTPESVAAADTTRRNNVTLSARTAARAFFSMLQDAARRRGGGLLSIPWDPMSWGSVYGEHSAWLTNTQTLLLPQRMKAGEGGREAGDAEEEQPATGDDAATSPGGAVAATAAAGSAQTRIRRIDADDMRAAVDFARAAYGYAFLCGGMSSIARYLHMQTVQRSTFDIIGGVSSEANTLAFCAVAGVPIEDVVLAEWQNTTYRCALRCRCRGAHAHACSHRATHTHECAGRATSSQWITRGSAWCSR
jgi:hypothetical protein